MPAGDNEFGSVLREAIGVGVFGIFATIFFAVDFQFHIVYGLWCSFFSLTALLHAPAHYFSKVKPQNKTMVWVAYWCLLLAIAGWFFVWSYRISHPRTESKPHPHFTFSLFLESAPDDVIGLTNDFLRVTKFSDNELLPVKLTSVLFMQRQLEQSNTVLRLVVKNDSSVDAESPEIIIMFEQDWRCLPDSAWIKEKPGSSGGFLVGEISPGILSTNKLQRWLYPLPSEWLLRGNSEVLPPFQISQLSYLSSVIFMARAVDSQPDAIGFNLLFPPEDWPFVVRKPFLILSPNMEHGEFKVSISPEKFNELVEQKFISRK